MDDDGSLGEPADFVQHKGSSINPERQERPHAHSVVAEPNNRYVYVVGRTPEECAKAALAKVEEGGSLP